MRPGTLQHRDLFCVSFVETHVAFEPAELPWPTLDETLLARIRSFPFWNIARSIEQRAGRMVACPRRISWEQVVRDLDAGDVRYAVVTDSASDSRDPDRGLWARLGPAGWYGLPVATARQVAEGLGLLAAPNQHIPIPLSEDR